MDTRGLTATPMDTQGDTPPAQLSTMDIITAGRGPHTTSSLEQTKDSSTSDEEHPEPKTWGITSLIIKITLNQPFIGIEKFNP